MIKKRLKANRKKIIKRSFLLLVIIVILFSPIISRKSVFDTSAGIVLAEGDSDGPNGGDGSEGGTGGSAGGQGQIGNGTSDGSSGVGVIGQAVSRGLNAIAGVIGSISSSAQNALLGVLDALGVSVPGQATGTISVNNVFNVRDIFGVVPVSSYVSNFDISVTVSSDSDNISNVEAQHQAEQMLDALMNSEIINNDGRISPPSVDVTIDPNNNSITVNNGFTVSVDNSGFCITDPDTGEVVIDASMDDNGRITIDNGETITTIDVSPVDSDTDFNGLNDDELSETEITRVFFERLLETIPNAPCYATKCTCSYIEGWSGELGGVASCSEATAACYKNATCKRQSNNRCGWTYTSEINECLKRTGGLTYSKIDIGQCSSAQSVGENSAGRDNTAEINCLKNLLSQAKDNLRLARHESNQNKISQAVADIDRIISRLTVMRDQQYEAEIAPLKEKLRKLEEQLANARSATEAWRIQQQINDVRRDIRDRERQQDRDYGGSIAPRPAPKPDTACTSTYEVKSDDCDFRQPTCTQTIHVMCHPSKKLKEIKKRTIKNPWYGGGDSSGRKNPSESPH